MGKVRTWFAQNFTKPTAVRMIRMAAQAVNRYELYEVAHDLFYHEGFHLFRTSDYNLPIPAAGDLDETFWGRQSEMIGVDTNDQYALDLLKTVFPPYVAEFRRRFPLRADDPEDFYLINGVFMAVDAHVYYALIRHFSPQLIVEIGSGRSTQVAAEACNRNLTDRGKRPGLTAIEPFPPSFLKADDGIVRLIIDKVQNVDLEVFTSLAAGDILFIDSTHALRSGGDVQFEYCEILPRLKPGVLVHIHDISLPRPYPRVYFEKNHIYWNEQYLLQAFLTFNSRFEVIWPGNYMMLRFPALVREVFPEYDDMREAYPQSEAASFWMRVKSN